LQYKERRFGDWWVIYAAGLDRGPVDQMNKAGGDPSQQLCYNKPFCCSAIRSYLYKPTALDQCFNNFTNGGK
jgi:hypothetical protein